MSRFLHFISALAGIAFHLAPQVTYAQSMPDGQIVSANDKSSIRANVQHTLQRQGSLFLTFNNRVERPSYANLNAQIGLERGRLLEQSFLKTPTEKDAIRSAQNNFDFLTFGRSVNLSALPRRRFGVRTRFAF